jgi:uncharacterized membrane protein YfcA
MTLGLNRKDPYAPHSISTLTIGNIMSSDELGMGWSLLAGIGCVSGFLAGLLGIGGGAIIVPALVFILPLFGISGEDLPRIAFATSVATIIPVGIASAQEHHAKGSVDWHIFALFAPSIVAGSFLAGTFAESVSAELLCLLFVVLVLSITPGMARRPGAQLLSLERQEFLPDPFSLSAVGLFGGALSCLIGFGNAFYSVPYLARFIAMRKVIGTAAALNAPLALAGVSGYLMSSTPLSCSTGCIGYVYIPAAAAIGVSAVLAAPFGARLVHILPVLLLRRVFAVVLAASAVNMAIKTLPLADAPVVVAALVQQWMSPAAAELPPRSAPVPICLVNPERCTSTLVARYGPRRYFLTFTEEYPSPSTIAAALAKLRQSTEIAAEDWGVQAIHAHLPRGDDHTPPVPQRAMHRTSDKPGIAAAASATLLARPALTY